MDSEELEMMSVTELRVWLSCILASACFAGVSEARWPLNALAVMVTSGVAGLMLYEHLFPQGGKR